MEISRKEFLQLSVAFVGAGLLGCGGDGNSDTPDAAGGASCLKNGTASQIGGNHGHTITVAIADIQAGITKTYDIMGTATHTHSVTLSAADFTTLSQNRAISKVSTTANSHEHSILISCI